MVHLGSSDVPAPSIEERIALLRSRTEWTSADLPATLVAEPFTPGE
jgi:hypothetical protein